MSRKAPDAPPAVRANETNVTLGRGDTIAGDRRIAWVRDGVESVDPTPRLRPWNRGVESRAENGPVGR